MAMKHVPLPQPYPRPLFFALPLLELSGELQVALYTPFQVCLEHTRQEEKPPQAQPAAGAE